MEHFDFGDIDDRFDIVLLWTDEYWWCDFVGEMIHVLNWAVGFREVSGP